MNITVLFDKENQREEISLMKSWNLSHQLNFIGFDIKAGEENLDLADIEATTLFIVLIGESTRFLDRNFLASLTLLVASTRAILCLNLNGFVGLDENHCPRTLWDCGAIHMPFGSEKEINYWLDHIKHDARVEQRTGSFHFKKHSGSFDLE